MGIDGGWCIQLLFTGPQSLYLFPSTCESTLLRPASSCPSCSCYFSHTTRMRALLWLIACVPGPATVSLYRQYLIYFLQQTYEDSYSHFTDKKVKAQSGYLTWGQLIHCRTGIQIFICQPLKWELLTPVMVWMNVCVSPRIICWKPNPQVDGIRRWDFWKVIRSWGHSYCGWG